MTAKEVLKNNILISMRLYMDGNTMQILNSVLSKELYNVDVVKMQTLPATADNTNRYIMDLFKVKKAPKLSENTAQAYRLSIEQLMLFENKPLTLLEETDIEAYLQYYKSKGNSNVSVNNQLRNLSAVFSWMRKIKLRTDNPCEAVERYPETEKPIDHLEPEEWEQLKNGCLHTRDRALLEFLRCTAMRAGEVPAVKVKDINWHAGTIEIYGHKTRRYRSVCLDSVAMHYIQEYLEWRGTGRDSLEPLFTCNRGSRIRALQISGILSSVKAIGARAGLERKIYSHLFRKTTATNIIRRGGTEEDAGEYLGHAPKGVTGKHYTYKGDSHVMKVFENYVAAV